MKKIHLHIEHLSLPGYTPAERRAFVAALERELVKGQAGKTTEPAHRATISIRADKLQPEALARSLVPSLLPSKGNNHGGQT